MTTDTLEAALTRRVPPGDLELEAAVLGAGLLDPAAARRIARELQPDDFLADQHRLIFGRLRALVDAGSGVDLLLLRRALVDADQLETAGGLDKLARLAEAGASAVLLPEYLARLRRDATMRRLIPIGTALAHGGYNGAGPADLIAAATRDLAAEQARLASSAGGVAPLGGGLGTFLAQSFPEMPPLIESLLTPDGCGWIAGEEKLGKTYFALEEALALALGDTVAGRFPVPTRQRIVFIEEEDPPRRAHLRLRALLRGRGLDPDDPAWQHDLDQWFQIQVWCGFKLEDPTWMARLDATCTSFKPAVIYMDVLRKITRKDLNKQVDMEPLLDSLDHLRRTHGVLFRLLHHDRKVQGFRAGRGSQEMAGSFVLAAWGECSLFFEPIGRTSGGPCRVEVQVKDGPPVPGFQLTIDAEGPPHAPTLVRLSASDPPAQTQAVDDLVLQAVATLPPTTPTKDGAPGVSITQLVEHLKKSDSTLRRSLNRLETANRVIVTGTMTKNKCLYGVNAS